MPFSVALTFLTGLLFLAGCGKPPASAKVPPVVLPSPSPAAAATASAGQSTPGEFEGVWAATDDQGQTFDIVLFGNGQAVTNWTKGSAGALGERGFWKVDNGRAIAIYAEGRADVIEAGEGGAFRHLGFAAGTPLQGKPASSNPATRVPGPGASFIGIWRLNKEPDGNYLYIALQSGGRAVSTINGRTVGTWAIDGGNARATWPDGWVDSFERSPEGWRKRSWVGPNQAADVDTSEAVRVGELKFSVAP